MVALKARESFPLVFYFLLSVNDCRSHSSSALDQVKQTAAVDRIGINGNAKSGIDSAGFLMSPTSAAVLIAPVELTLGAGAIRMSAHAHPQSNGDNGGTRLQPTFELLLGEQDPTSPYLTRNYFSEPNVADARDRTGFAEDVLQHISELDPQAFEVYKLYTNTGKIGFRCPLVKTKYM